MGTPSPEEPLEQLSLARHRDLEGPHWGFAVWLRRVVTAVLLLFVLLAATNQFGQSADTTVTSSSAAVLKVVTPARLRSGLIFQTRVELTARRTIAHPTIVLDGGWFDGMTLNSLQPAPTDQTPKDGGSTFVFPQLAAGETLTVWFEWSVNPTNVTWMRPQTVRVDDGHQTLLTYRTTLTVFP
jgi:hypothetical protein